MLTTEHVAVRLDEPVHTALGPRKFECSCGSLLFTLDRQVRCTASGEPVEWNGAQR